MPGTLFVVATPIGNLEDMTLRGIRVLGEVDLIAAEDTRRTRKLLAHFDISRPLVSLREHNEFREGPKLVDRLLRGSSIALVSDAGTPGISDPGAMFVRLARQAGVPVVAVPGPSAVTAALSVSGLAVTEFAFMGFPPPAGSDRRRWFERLGREPRVTVFFEAPHRIRRTLSDATDYLAKRQILVHREITKINEDFVIWTNTAEDIAERVRDRGEFVVIVGDIGRSVEPWVDPAESVEMIGRMRDLVGLSLDDAVMAVSAVTGASEGTIRKAVKKHEISVKQRNQTPA